MQFCEIDINKDHKKKNIYNTIVRNIITYKAENWVINKDTKGKIIVTEIEFQRRSCTLKRMDRITIEEIRRRTGAEKNAIKYVEEKRLM